MGNLSSKHKAGLLKLGIYCDEFRGRPVREVELAGEVEAGVQDLCFMGRLCFIKQVVVVAEEVDTLDAVKPNQ
jgi:hypothetical protein